MTDWSFEERLETTRIYSLLSNTKHSGLMECRPFRSPHHTISDAGLIGGGRYPRPGEVSLAHNGVLFLDELPEFRRHVLEVLRQPLEDGRVTISRAQTSLTYPSRVMLVAAMNPCPCGYYGDRRNNCHCSEQQISRYRSKISGPLLDRIDIHMEVGVIDFEKVYKKSDSETSAQVRERINRAHAAQTKRFSVEGSLHANAQMGTREIQKYCRIEQKPKRLLRSSVDKLGLSVRACHKVLKMARTIADLAGENDIGAGHLAEAIQYRRSGITE